MNPVTRISPVSDADVAGLTGAHTLADLGRDITAMPGMAPGRAARPGRSRIRTRLLVGIPAAAALAVGGLVAASIGSPGQHLGPVNVGPPSAQAAVLTITRHGGYLDVIVANPLADAAEVPGRVRPAPPEHLADAGARLAVAGGHAGLLRREHRDQAGHRDRQVLHRRRRRRLPGRGRVPLNFAGHADLTFGRAARPGERYETTAAANAPGELLHGLRYDGKTVSAVLAMLAARHISVPHFLLSVKCENVSRDKAPGNWYVTDADPWAPGAVQLWVSKSWPASCAQQRAAGTGPAADGYRPLAQLRGSGAAAGQPGRPRYRIGTMSSRAGIPTAPAAARPASRRRPGTGQAPGAGS